MYIKHNLSIAMATAMAHGMKHNQSKSYMGLWCVSTRRLANPAQIEEKGSAESKYIFSFFSSFDIMRKEVGDRDFGRH